MDREKENFKASDAVRILDRSWSPYNAFNRQKTDKLFFFCLIHLLDDWAQETTFHCKEQFIRVHSLLFKLHRNYGKPYVISKSSGTSAFFFSPFLSVSPSLFFFRSLSLLRKRRKQRCVRLKNPAH